MVNLFTPSTVSTVPENKRLQPVKQTPELLHTTFTSLNISDISDTREA